MRLLLNVVLVLLAVNMNAQFDDLVTWTASFDADNSTIILKAEMKKDWVIYSQDNIPDGPIPVSFEFEPSAGVTFEGVVKELSEPIIELSELFEAKVRKFKNEAVFTQKIESDGQSALIKGNVTFMTCDSRRCLPPRRVAFEVKI